jgi:hypothetical protein
VPVSVSPVFGVAPGVRGGLAAVAPGAPAGVQPGVGVLSSASQGPAPGVVPGVVPGKGTACRVRWGGIISFTGSVEILLF